VTSSFTSFQENLLVAAFELSERTGNEMVDVKEIISSYPLWPRSNWIMQSLRDFLARGLINDTLTIGGEEEQTLWLTAAGMREAEHLIEKGVMLIHSDDMQQSGRWTDGSVVTTEFLNDRPHSDLAVVETREIAVDTSSWTGLPRTGVLSEQQVSRLRAGLTQVEQALSEFGGTNEERAQARSYFVAINALADAPEPPADLIWKMIERVNQIAGIASLFVSIMALFQAAAH
jgi:hypothetical protein